MLVFRSEYDICDYLIMNNGIYNVTELVTEKNPTLRLSTWLADNDFEFRHFVIVKHSKKHEYKILSKSVDSFANCWNERMSFQGTGHSVSTFSVCDIGLDELLIIHTTDNGSMSYYIAPKNGMWRGWCPNGRDIDADVEIQ